MRTVVLLLSISLIASATLAAEERYLCTIERAYSLGPSGLSRNRRLMADLVTTSFEIDRRTGAVTGSRLENLRDNPIVVAPGDNENSFQAYWIVRGLSGARVRFIEVQEYVEGQSKPFRAVVQNWTYTGSCE